jgi:tetratricopeptide (TPR) repeat protein
MKANNDLRSAMQQGVRFFQAGNLTAAEHLFQQVLSIAPKNADALHLLGLIRSRVGDQAQAIKLIKKATKISPRTDYFHRNLGLILSEAGSLNEAVRAFKSAIALNPKDSDSHNDLGVIYSQQDRTQEAIAEYKKAIRINPKNPRALSNLGNDLIKAGSMDEAIECHQRSIELNPNSVEAYYNLGIALREHGRMNDAIEAFLGALKIDPNYADAYADLGIALREVGRLDDAIEMLNRAIALAPESKDAHNNLGITLRKQGKMEEAKASLKRALEIDPDCATAHKNMGSVLRDCGKFDEAMASYRKAIRLDSQYIKTYRMLARTKKHTEYDADMQEMERLFADKGTLDDDRMHLAFGLGKAYEDIKEYRKGFYYIAEANRLKRMSYDYSLAEDIEKFERIKSVFSEEFFMQHQKAGSSDRTPIFILGMPRSGTTLVEQILASHSQVYGAGELMHLKRISRDPGLLKTDKKFPLSMLDIDDATFNSLGEEYVKRLRAHADIEVAHITDKMPHNFLLVGLIRVILPNAKIVHCVRNPMDNCLSIYKNYFSGTHKYAYDMTELGQYYNLYQDMMGHWRAVIPGFMLDLGYEEMVSDQEQQTRRMLEFCGLPWEDACLSFHKTERQVATASATQVRRPIYRDSMQLSDCYGDLLAPLQSALYD